MSEPGRDGGQIMLTVRSWVERARQSLFVLPALILGACVVLAQLLVVADRALDDDQLPGALATSTENARSILSVVAGGTITAASIVFSLTLVAVQLASSQFSPRILRGFVGDRFQQVVIGVVVGTFAFSLTVLRAVRDLGEEDPFQPQLSVLVAVVLAVVSLLAVLASIDHTAKGLQVGQVLDTIAADTLAAIRRQYPRFDEEEQPESTTQPGRLIADAVDRRSDGPIGAVIEAVATSTGWIRQISREAMVDATPEGAVIHLDATVGSYVSEGTVLARIECSMLGDEDPRTVARGVAAAVDVGRERTMQQDVAFGFTQFGDVAVKALSPGINDPNTALEVIARLDAVLVELLVRRMPDGALTDRGRTIHLSKEVDHDDFFDLTIEPICRYARDEPRVLAAVVELMHSVSARARRLEPSADVTPCDRWVERIRELLPRFEVDADRRIVESAISEDVEGESEV